jgi:hypothetical protein
MDTNPPVPIPLFDTLEHFNNNKQDITESYQKLDFQHATNFLYSYRGSLATFNSYRREIERLMQWCWLIQKKSLNALTRNDFETFLEFCQAPPKNWIGIQHVERFISSEGLRIPNPQWRPFVAVVSKKAFRDGKMPNVKAYALSTNALQAIFSILSSFYNYLEQEDYVTLIQSRKSVKKANSLEKSTIKPL